MSLERALKLCGVLPGERFSVAAIREREIRPACFNDVAAANAFLAQYQGWNHYLCGNPVRADCGGRPKAADVTESRILLMDCDPDPDPEAARTAALRLAGYLNDYVAQYPIVIDSGRGTQLWVRTGPMGVEARRTLARGLAACQGPSVGYRWDATFDPSRLMRLPGSTNLKTGHVAQVVHEGTGPPITERDIALLKLPSQPAVAPASSLFTNSKPMTADMALVTGAVRDIWDEPADKGERSKRDFRLVLHLLRAGATEDVASRLLYAMPGSKAAADSRGQDYWDATLASVRRHLAQEEQLRARAMSLPEAAKSDAGAPFEPEALDALLLIRGGEEAEWQRLRAALKAAKVPIRALEQALEARSREAKGADPCRLRFVADELKRVGWFKQTREDEWINVDGTEARATMRAQGQDPDAEVKTLTDTPWRLVNEPFQKEDLDGRRWNKDAARFAVTPEPGPCPTWFALLNHVGRSLDDIVKVNEWCIGAGVVTGGAYLMKWIAAMLQRPKARTAYLFLHGPQEAGKSTLHESLRLLLSKGYVKANHALKSKEGFNGEIANAILCAVEEVDLSDPRRDTHERVKDWVTGEVIGVRALYRQSVDFVNCTHWIQCAQKRSFMPVLPGDTRITEIHVEIADAAIPKEAFMARIEKEAPAFLSHALREPLPESAGRLFIPALATRGKTEQADASRTDLEEWMETHPWIELEDTAIVGAFLEWLPMSSKVHWDRARVMRELPPTARRDRALAVALRGALGPGPLAVRELHGALPGPVATDWNVVTLGKALRRLSTRCKWLRQTTVIGRDVWQIH